MNRESLPGLAAILVGLLLTIAAHGGEYPFKVYNPSDKHPRGSLLEGQPQIYESVRKLLEHLKEAREMGFITTRRGGDLPPPALKWRVETVTIISPDIVVVAFSEGHVVVTGIFVRNHRGKCWDIRTGIHGEFTVKTFRDPEVEEGE